MMFVLHSGYLERMVNVVSNNASKKHVIKYLDKKATFRDCFHVV